MVLKMAAFMIATASVLGTGRGAVQKIGEDRNELFGQKLYSNRLGLGDGPSQKDNVLSVTFFGSSQSTLAAADSSPPKQ